MFPPRRVTRVLHVFVHPGNIPAHLRWMQEQTSVWDRDGGRRTRAHAPILLWSLITGLSAPRGTARAATVSPRRSNTAHTDTQQAVTSAPPSANDDAVAVAVAAFAPPGALALAAAAEGGAAAAVLLLAPPGRLLPRPRRADRAQ